MKAGRFFLLVVIASVFSAAFAQEKKAPAGVDIRVTVESLRNKNGQLLVALFTRPKGFPSDSTHAYQSIVTNIAAIPLPLVFTNVPAGICAVGISHDENGNGRMDTRSFGRPKEGYGVSGSPVKRMGPPRFKDCAIQVATTNMSITVRIIYPDK